MASLLSGLTPPDPYLPPDLEREIFEIAALSDTRFIPRLLLVAQRVKTWIEHLLYRVLCVSAPRLIRGSLRIPHRNLLDILDLRPANFLAHTRHLSLTCTLTVDDTVHLLSHCDGIVNLGLFQFQVDATQHTLLSALAKLKLERLATDVESLFPEGVDFTHIIFAQITHLDLLRPPTADDPHAWAEGCAQLPHLTHISFTAPPIRIVDPISDSAFRTILRGILRRCARIEVLVLIVISSQLREYMLQHLYFADDPRSVLMAAYTFSNSSFDDWERGARGGEDHWMRAERFVKQRLSGEVEESEYFI
ncbi:hypothetical protein DFH07DRAFT_956266 [Mycena maculata]|uniref:Uncharacterized protein n=1 Tax=Mycena maculata TaxID=230809 RepID=A0AAD7NKA0_9AGAR|nr:hypothetical protein DFH07DRAFT_956266 [Mycena maculata]